MEQVLALRNATLPLRRTIAVLLGTALVALAAQVAVPLPGTPVPMTLQPLAVLIVGGLLGNWLGAGGITRRRPVAGTDGRVSPRVSPGGIRRRSPGG